MYLFFLGAVPLPITPAALTIKTPSLNKTVSLVNDGEINIPKAAGLREISFEFLIPRIQKYPFANYHIPYYTATIITKALAAWKDTKFPFRFIVVRTSPKYLPLDYEYIKCVIEDFEYNEDAEAHGMDVMCSIRLKEYKDYGTKVVPMKQVENADGTVTETASVKKYRPSNKQVSSTANVQEGDTLPSMAKRETGNASNWTGIAAANGYKTPSQADAEAFASLSPFKVDGVGMNYSYGQTSYNTNTYFPSALPSNGTNVIQSTYGDRELESIVYFNTTKPTMDAQQPKTVIVPESLIEQGNVNRSIYEQAFRATPGALQTILDLFGI